MQNHWQVKHFMPEPLQMEQGLHNIHINTVYTALMECTVPAGLFFSDNTVSIVWTVWLPKPIPGQRSQPLAQAPCNAVIMHTVWVVRCNVMHEP